MIHDFSLICGGGDILLKPLDQEYIEDLRLLRNRDENRRWFTYSEVISEKEQLKWFEKYSVSEDDMMFIIEEKERPGGFIGAAGIYNIDRENGSAEFGRIIVDRFRTSYKGVGTSVADALCRFGFDSLKLKYIWLSVYKNNVRAISAYKRAGFIESSRSKTDELITMTNYNRKGYIAF